MILGLFGKKTQNQAEKDILESINKYSNELIDDLNLHVRLKFKNKVYITYLEELSGRDIVFREPTEEYDFSKLNGNKLIKLEFFSEKGIYVTNISINEKIIKEDIIYYKGEIKHPIQKYQRRSKFRLPVSLDVIYTMLPRETIEYNGVTKDISVGGMLMETHENIYQSKELRLKVDIEGKIYDIKSEIIRKRRSIKNGTYLYHLKFTKLNQKQKGEISRFIFDTKNMQLKSNMRPLDGEAQI